MAAKSRDLLIDVLGLAALSVNGWFSRRAAALRMMRTRRFSCCERAQREIAMAVMGSVRSFAALGVNDRYADFPAVRLAPLYGRYLRIAVVGRAPHFASAARSQTLVNGPKRPFVSAASKVWFDPIVTNPARSTDGGYAQKPALRCPVYTP